MNSEADRLADGDTRGFDPGLRVHAEVRQIKWLVLDRLMKAGAAFHRESVRHSGKVANSLVRGKKEHPAKRRMALREREPW